MKYLLSETEYQALKKVATIKDKVAEDELQGLCTKVADHMPIPCSWDAGRAAEPWGCILSATTERYCDDCPVRNLCPNPDKNFSK
jgi:hypothetical protein